MIKSSKCALMSGIPNLAWSSHNTLKKSMAFATSNCQKHQYNSVTKIENLALKQWLKDFNGILWGQQLIVYSDRHNLTQDTTLGIIELASVLLKIDIEEIGPVIVYTKERIIILWQILISQYNFTPAPPISKEKSSKIWGHSQMLVWCGICHTHKKQQATLRVHELCVCQSQQEGWGNISPHHSQEIAEQQHKDKSLCALFKTDKVLLLEDTNLKLLFKDDTNNVLLIEDTMYTARKDTSL